MLTDPIQAMDNLNLDEDSRILREHSFEDANHHPTSQGLVALHHAMWAEHRESIAAKLRRAIAAKQAKLKEK